MALFNRINNILTESNRGTNGGKSVRSFQNVLGAAASGNVSLEEGQIVKGEVTDIRNGKVTIKISEDRTITANLEGTSEISIGQYAAFRITANNANGISLTAIAGSKALNMDATVKKALDAAGLPRTDANMEIVRALLSNQMSIDKQSIMKQLQQSYQFKDIDVHTLVFMNKHHIPITSQNAEQFENFRNNEHRIMQEVADLAENIPNMLKQLKDGDTSLLLKTNQQILSIIGNAPISVQNTSPGTSLPLSQILPDPQERFALAQFLELYDLPDAIKSDVINGTIPLNKAADPINQSYQIAVELEQESENIPEFLSDKNTAMSNMSEEAAPEPKFSTDQFLSPVIRHVMDSFTSIQHENNELASFLPKEARAELLDLLKEIPLPKGLQAQILNGSMKSSSFLAFIKNTIAYLNPQTAETLLTHKHYQSILKQNILSHWTLTPEQLTNQPDLGEFYEGMYRQLSALESLSLNLSGDTLLKTGQQASSLKENIDFMKTLNQMFSYIQLPLKLKEQNIHSDLYIYTNKRELLKNNKDIRILLHLDMTYMGVMDIHVVLSNNTVLTKFYLETDEARDLVRHNILQLEESLKTKGFLLQSETYTRKQDLDPISEFMEKDAPAASMKRYTFDIRT